MAVMNNMREYTKTILIILVLAFLGTIIFDWGMNILGTQSGQNVVGEVEGVEITTRQFEQTLAQQREQFRARTGNEPTESQEDYLRNQAWESLVQEIVVQKALQENDIQASNAEVKYRIFEDPPEFLRRQEVFQNEQKQFDMAKYQAALNAGGSTEQWIRIENLIRQSLPYEKFQQRLQATVRVTDHELKREYLKRNQKATVEYMFIGPNRFLDKDFEITDEQIEEYYEAHQEDFREEEKRKIDYVTFSTTPTAEDSASQWKLARRLVEQAKEGDDFSELVAIYSEDPGTQDKGGSLGYFGEGEMVKPFEEAAFGANAGEIVGPVETTHGLHVIKVEDKKIEGGEEQVKASHILLKFEASSETYNTAQDDAIYFSEEARTVPFEQLAKEMNKEIQSTPLFVKGNGFIPGLGLNKRASNFIFSNDVGEVSGVENYAQGFFVCKITEVQPEHIRPLSDVRKLIETKILAEKRMAMAGELAQKIHDSINAGTSFEEAAKQDSLEIKEVSVGRGGFVPDVGREPKFIGAAFALDEPNAVSKPVEATRGFYILKLLKKDEFNEEAFQAQKKSLEQELLRRKQTQAFANWYASAKAEAEIKDYRYRYY